MESPYRSASTPDAPATGPRHALLDELVHQFRDPYAFYRELAQNSIDAGSTQIDIELRWQPSGGLGLATMQVADRGSGMSRRVIEDYLLTKFRSTKDGDASKIGKFGIGFLSVLAPEPALIVVETAVRNADGSSPLDERWRLLLSPDLTYELLHHPGATPGTRVIIHKEVDAIGYRGLVQRSREAVWRWCRHAEVAITFAAGGEDGSPAAEVEAVNEPVTLDTPFQVEHRDDERGLLVVAGPARGEPTGAFYKRGLLLEETGEAMVVEGVSFKVLSKHLSHTLSRDHVKRDGAWEKALRALRQLCQGPLREQLRQEIRALAHVGGAARDADLEALLVYGRTCLRAGDLWFPLAGGGAVDGRALKRAVRRAKPVLHARRGSPLAVALGRQGIVVLSGDSAGVLAQAVAFVESKALPAEARYTLCVADEAAPASAEPLCRALHALLEAAGARCRRVVLASVEGHDGGGGTAVLCDELGEALETERSLRSPFALFAPRTLCLSRAQPLVQAALRVAARAPGTAALLCARVVAAAWSELGDKADRRMTDAALEDPAPERAS